MDMRDRTAPLAALGIALAARLLFLGDKSIWVDEAYAAALVRLPFAEAASLFGRGTPHPAGGLLLVWLSGRLFGETGAGIRLLTALLSASAAIPVHGFLGRRFGGAGAVTAALLWAVCPWSVSLGQEAWVYGPLAALSMWALFLADRAWRGSRAALAGLLAVSAAGFWVQHVFVLTALACLGLYLAEPRASRVRAAVPAAAAFLMALAFVPIVLPFLDQFGRRAARMASAGQPFPDFRRMLVRPPLVVPGLLADGLVPGTVRELLSSTRLIATAAAAAAIQAWHVLAAALSRRLDRGTAWWLALSGLLPFAVFLRDDPTARQFPLVWAAFAGCAAAAASRRPWAGIPALALCAALLPAYYRVPAFPYHRSGWMQAADYVISREPGAPVVLAGSRTALQAWEFYSRGRTAAIAPEGADPYRGEEEQAPRRDAGTALDSLLEADGRAWVVVDRWGGADPLEDARAAVLLDTSFGTVGVRLVEAAR
jgi:hypothetical protein